MGWVRNCAGPQTWLNPPRFPQGFLTRCKDGLHRRPFQLRAWTRARGSAWSAKSQLTSLTSLTSGSLRVWWLKIPNFAACSKELVFLCSTSHTWVLALAAAGPTASEGETVSQNQRRKQTDAENSSHTLASSDTLINGKGSWGEFSLHFFCIATGVAPVAPAACKVSAYYTSLRYQQQCTTASLKKETFWRLFEHAFGSFSQHWPTPIGWVSSFSTKTSPRKGNAKWFWNCSVFHTEAIQALQQNRAASFLQTTGAVVLRRRSTQCTSEQLQNCWGIISINGLSWLVAWIYFVQTGCLMCGSHQAHPMFSHDPILLCDPAVKYSTSGGRLSLSAVSPLVVFFF